MTITNQSNPIGTTHTSKKSQIIVPKEGITGLESSTKEKIYTAYSINFRPPDDRKPTSKEIKRYSIFIKEHITIIDPKIIILMGSTAMEAVTGINDKISLERGNWKEIILNNKTYPLIISFSPSYLIRFPENKRYSWEDLKKIKRKIEDLNIKV